MGKPAKVTRRREPFRQHVMPPSRSENSPLEFPSFRLASAPLPFNREIMSLPSQSHSKKRKQAAVREVGEEDTQPALKKSKNSLGKKLKRDKSKAGSSTRHGASSGSKGEFRTITSTLSVSIPPVYAMEPRRGVQEMLDGMLMRYGFW